jgi:EpsG family
MNLMLLPIFVMSLFSLIEFLFPDQRRMNNQLFKLAFFIVYSIIAVKYYYGPDIRLYVPLYDKIESPWDIFLNGTVVGSNVEIGFVFFCSIFKWLGFSFWFFTFTITSIYFLAIYKLFNKLDKYKTFALFALVVFEANILFFEYRQSLSVAFYIFSILAYFDKKYSRFILFSILSILFHKSAILVCLLTFTMLFLPTITYSKKYYILLLICLVTCIFFSIGDIATLLTKILPFNSGAIFSIKHHLTIEKNIQVVLFTYIIGIYSLYYYGKERNYKRYYALMLSFILFIAIFYKYWFFLGRFRSCFMPLIIVFVIKEITDNQYKSVFLKQLLVLSVYTYCFFYTRGVFLSNENSATKVLNATTIFTLKDESEEQIKAKNIKLANKYFDTEYLKNHIKDTN